MTVRIRDAGASAADRGWILDSYPLYVADLAQGGVGGAFTGPSAAALRDELASLWFSAMSSLVVVILRDGERVGFARVQRETVPGSRLQMSYHLTDFYVAAAVRRHGLGREAANLLFRRFAGAWHVSGSARDRVSLAFWRSVISSYTGGRYTVRRQGGELRHSFHSAPDGT
ncbi:MAG: GNAT family N-acetyltransferase [Steroidobacteraceae bacterium]